MLKRFTKFFSKKTHLVLAAIICLLFLAPIAAIAQTNVSAGPDSTFGLQQIGDTGFFGTDDIRVIVARIINIALGLLGIIAFGLVLYAGYTIMTAGGNEEKVTEGKNILVNAVIGLAIILSAYAIVSFVITRLSTATGTGSVGELPVDCSNPGFASQHTDICGFETLPATCGINQFVVRSITPNTPVGPGTGMNNVTVRVVFSQPVAASITDPASVFTIVGAAGTSVNGLFNFSFLDGSNRTVVEAIPTAANGQIPRDRYTVTVNEQVTNDQGDAPQQNFSCGVFPITASFEVDTDGAENHIPPNIANNAIRIDGQSSLGFLQVARGTPHNITATLSDDNGIGYVHLTIERVRPAGDTAHTTVLYDGPPVTRQSGSSAAGTASHPNFDWSYQLLISRNTTPLERYRVTLEVFDINGNSSISRVDYVVVGELCQNNILDPGEITTDRGGVCLDNGPCTEDSQCLSGHCDVVAGICLNYPVITNVSPWNGAAGNWVTIQGTGFGETPGNVSFGVSENASLDNINYTVNANLAQCSVDDSWHDNYIIVQIPDDVALPQNSQSAIRVSRSDVPTFFDTTIDASGPNSWTDSPNGLFTKNNILRPGLCSISPSAGQTRTPGTVYGNALSTSATDMRVFFGGFQSSISNPQTNQFQTSVPINLQPGRVSVSVVLNDQASNGIPFTVQSSREDEHPVISSVSPSRSTPGSYITITGSHFGADTGIVYLAPDTQPATVCTESNSSGSGSTCLRAIVSLPAACGDTWDDRQIVAQIPLAPTPAPVGAYRVIVENSSNMQGVSPDPFSVIAGNGSPTPSLCSVVPNFGPAPLANGSVLHLTGVNLSPETMLHFWNRGASIANPTNWLTQPSASIRRISDTSIESAIPQDINGYSMQTGPIVANVSGVISNSVNYTVNDCRTSNTALPSGSQCCTVGPDAGMVVTGRACGGESRNAGYMWRFTTALIPSIPRVVEGCDSANWNNQTQPLSLPSPSPWRDWPQGLSACLNLSPAVRFTIDMDETSFANNVRVLECGSGASPDCTRPNDVSDQFSPTYNAQVLILARQSATQEFTPNTWYRVMLLDGIQSAELVTSLGVQQFVEHRPLQRTRPCGRTSDGQETAYCFEFKTATAGSSGAGCSLSGVAIQPPEKTVNILGQILDSNNQPFVYTLWGRANQVCSVMSVDGLGWNWSINDSANPDRATVTRDTVYDSRATVEALGNTAPASIQIQALQDQTRPGHLTTPGLSNLTINLGNPTVVEFWPSCTASCINAGIGARFNREMVTSQFIDGNIRLYRCPDESCYHSGNTLVAAENAENMRVQLDVPAVAQDRSTGMVITANPRETLLPDTWYQVQIDNINAVSGYNYQTNPPTPIPGTANATKIWKFKTKNDISLCSVGSVALSPNPFTASVVGEKTTYTAFPVGSPDSCSTGGQMLRPEDYGWVWDTVDRTVATVTNFTSVSRLKSYCTSTCLPRGSDISSDYSGTVALCGNGVVDLGEDCDISALGEIAGVSCSLNCLRPGNTNAGAGANQCGNGVVDTENGEECDPQNPSDTNNCTAVCLHTGSNPESQRALDVSRGIVNNSYCGSGTTAAAITGGEECEGGVGGYVTNVSCSSRCLKLGTQLAQSWCDLHANDQIRISSTQTIPANQTSECRSAQSVCGNRILEASEECENLSGVIYVHSATSLAPVASNLPATTCNTSCLLQNLCSSGGSTVTPYDIPSYLSCTPGTPGCDISGCTLLGSSVGYEDSSICGDGVVGSGESAWCELSPTEASAAEASATVPQSSPAIVIRNPVQAVTAVGLGTVTDGLMSTRVQATAVASRQTVNGQLSLNDIPDVVGQGDYSLQCGYTEFISPRTVGTVESFNNCPNSNNGTTSGVGTNSCCYTRPTRTDNYPFDGAGLSGVSAPAGQSADPVCRNTLITVTFSGNIDESTLPNNLIVARGDTTVLANPTSHICHDGEVDITNIVSPTLARVGLEQQPAHWWNRVWQVIRNFVARLFDVSVFASDNNDRSVTSWCSGGVRVIPQVSRTYGSNGSVESTKVTLAIQNALEANSTYAVFLRGGTQGIKDVRGVGIWSSSAARPNRDDSFIFRTGSDICSISEVTVNPASQLFRTPNQENLDDDVVPNNAEDFTATVSSASGQQITPIPGVYDWQWSWGPTNNSIVSIASDDATNHQSTIRMRSTTVQGQATAYANATITADALHIDPAHISENELNHVYSATVNISSLFCANPWPAIPASATNPNPLTIYPYEDGNTPNRSVNDDGYIDILNADGTHSGYFDGSPLLPALVGGSGLYFNFSMGYCADSGRQGNLSDDLPYLRPLVLTQSGSLTPVVPAPTCPTGYNPLRVNGQCIRTALSSCTGVAPAEWSTHVYSRSTTIPNQCVPNSIFTPRIAGHYVDSTRTIVDRPYDVVVANGYAYVASLTNSRLVVFDVRDPNATPILVRSISNGFGGATLGSVHKLFLSGNYLYAAVPDTDRLEIFDVSTPDNPVAISSFGMAAGRAMDRPYDVAVSGDMAYIASLNSDGLEMVDVSDKRNPRHVAAVFHGSNGALLDGASSVAVVGDYAYVISSISDSLQAIRINNSTVPATLEVAGSLVNDTANRVSLLAPTGITASSDGQYLYISDFGSATAASAIEVVSIVNPALPQHVRSIRTGEVSNGITTSHFHPSDLTVSGNYLFVVSEAGTSFEMFDISNPSLPLLLRSIPSSVFRGTPVDTESYTNGAESVFVSGDYAYISHNYAGIQIFNIAPPPVVSATCGTDPNVRLQTDGTCTVRPSCGNPALYEYDSGRDRCIELHALPLPDNSILTPLKKFLFLNDKNNDAIGIQVFANEPRATVRDWYVKHFGSIPSRFRDTTVDGYNAITDGDTYYVNALNVADSHQVYNNIYLLSLTPNAQESTKQVFSSLMNSLKFNINLTNIGYCSVGNGKNADGTVNYDDFNTAATPSVACRTDFECPDVDGVSRICANAKTKLLRDWKRLEDIRIVQSAIESYKSAPQATYPTLTAGTYVTGYTNSKWPSWSRFGTLLGVGLPHDPVDQWSGCTGSACSGADTETFWNPATSQFICPNKMQVMEYKVDSSSGVGGGYQVYNTLEYLTTALDFVSQYVDLTHFTNAPSCTAGAIFTALPGSCGDGVVNSGEECDPPGTRANRVAPGCTVPEPSICGATCQWSRPEQCALAQICGNGRVEGSEICDDGTLLNGSYGHCGLDCRTQAPQYCGNGHPVNNAQNDWLDRDTRGSQLEICEVTEPRYSETGFCRKVSCLMPQYEFANLSSGLVLNVGTGLYDYTDFNSVHFVDATHGWAVGERPVQANLQNCSPGLGGNGLICPPPDLAFYNRVGNSWNLQYSVPGGEGGAIRSVYFTDLNHGWAVGAIGGEQTIWRTIDGGVNWVATRFSGNGPALNAVYFINANIGWVVGGQTTVLATTNGGVSWNRLYGPTPGSSTPNQTIRDFDSFLSVYFINAGEGWAVGTAGIVYHTTDGGSSWQEQTSGTTRQLNSVHFATRLIGWAAGTALLDNIGGSYGPLGSTGPVIIKTMDGGRTWSAADNITGGTPNFNSIDFVDELHGMVVGESATGGVVAYATADGGSSWQLQTIPTRTAGILGSRVTNYPLSDVSMINASSGFAVGPNEETYSFSMDTAYCSRIDDCTTDNNCKYGDSCVSVVDPGYHLRNPQTAGATQGSSCSNDCQRAGGYCGDGIVQSSGPIYFDSSGNQIPKEPYEDCDDGPNNGAPGGRCNQYCLLNLVAGATPSTNLPVVCGNGVLQAGETCDEGANNNVPCTPTYNHACTYCSSFCSVITVNPTAYCGNGQVDVGGGSNETCDINSSGQVVNVAIQNGVTNNAAVNLCTDVGSWTCTNNCTSLSNTCKVCGVKDLSIGGAIPRLAILNPMVDVSVPVTQATPNQTTWANSTFAGLFSAGATGSLWPSSPLGSGFFTRQQQSLSAPTSGIESDLLCSNRYEIAFNPSFGGDRFQYPVSGERGAVQNEMIVSPAILGDGYRIVVRWTNREAINTIFTGNLYSEAFNNNLDFPQPVISLTQAATDENNPTYLDPENNNAPYDRICDELRQVSPGYWWPAGCSHRGYGPDAVDAISPGGYENGIFVHPVVHLQNTYTQAMTFVAGTGPIRSTNRNNDNTPGAQNQINTNYAFFVSAPGQPITRYANSDIQVEVYTYHAGQDPLNSIYKPTYTFSIRNAVRGQAGDAYWHVFNIVRVQHPDQTYGYELQRFGGVDENTGDGSIESGFANVQCNIPGHYCPLTGGSAGFGASGLPDFTISSLSATPANAVAYSNTPITVTGVIANRGFSPSADSLYSVCLDFADCGTNISHSLSNGQVSTINAGGLSPQITATFNASQFYSPVGSSLTHTIYFCADVQDNTRLPNVQEGDETNNCSSVQYTLAPSGTACTQDSDCNSAGPSNYCRSNICTYLVLSNTVCSADWQCGFDLLNPYHCDTVSNRCAQYHN